PAAPAMAWIGSRSSDLGRWTLAIHRAVGSPVSRSNSLADYPMPETADEVVVDEPCRLHQGIADRRTDEREAPFLQILANCVRDERACGDPTHAAPRVLDRTTVNEPPDVVVETPEGLPHDQEGPSVLDRRRDLEPVPHDAGVGQERLDPRLVEAGHRLRVEVF